MKLKHICLLTALITSAFCHAQGLKIYSVNGNITEFKASEVEKIVFYDETQMGDDGTVDLGLSVKWASCNLGASDPRDYGNLYAWGELSPKQDYSWATYRFANGDIEHLTKYNNDPDYGLVDNLSHLEPADDVATETLGADWHIPSREEWTELREQCEWTWNDADGGFTVTGPNGNSIFLPANGYNFDDIGGYKWGGEYGYYEISDVNTTYWYYEDCYAFYAPDAELELDAEHYFFYMPRAAGLGVRPVKIKK